MPQGHSDACTVAARRRAPRVCLRPERPSRPHKRQFCDAQSFLLHSVSVASDTLRNGLCPAGSANPCVLACAACSPPGQDLEHWPEEVRETWRKARVAKPEALKISIGAGRKTTPPLTRLENTNKLNYATCPCKKIWTVAFKVHIFVALVRIGSRYTYVMMKLLYSLFYCMFIAAHVGLHIVMSRESQ